MTTIRRPAGVGIVSPYITVVDVAKTAEFYQKAFKFKIRELAGPDNSPEHGEFNYLDQLIMVGKQGAYDKDTLAPVVSKTKSPMSLYLYCDDVDCFYQDAVAAGAVSIDKPQDAFWGDRICRLQCLDGYVWCFASHPAAANNK